VQLLRNVRASVRRGRQGVPLPNMRCQRWGQLLRTQQQARHTRRYLSVVAAMECGLTRPRATPHLQTNPSRVPAALGAPSFCIVCPTVTATELSSPPHLSTILAELPPPTFPHSARHAATTGATAATTIYAAAAVAVTTSPRHAPANTASPAAARRTSAHPTEPYIHPEEPFIHSKETFHPLRQPISAAGGANRHPKEPYMYSKEPYVDSKQPFRLRHDTIAKAGGATARGCATTR